MPFNGTVFFEAVQMFDDSTSLKYLRSLWYYWQHTHCEGLPNDDEGLRLLCKCDSQNWARTKGLIFDGKHFFVLENGKWHQSRCRKVYVKELERYQKNLQKTEPARNAALVIRTVSGSVTDENWLKSLKENACYTGIDIDRELGKLASWCSVNGKQASRKRFINWLNRAEKPLVQSKARNGPTLSEVQSVVFEKCGNTPQNQAFAAQWHLFWNGKNWIKQGRPMDWESELAIELAKNGKST